MNLSFLWLCVFLRHFDGVFGAEMVAKRKTYSVMEGESVTLATGFKNIKDYDSTVWWFKRLGGNGFTQLTEIGHRGAYINNEIFGDRLQLNNQTGSLTIRNIRITQSGFYKVTCQVSDHTARVDELKNDFNVTVYAHLPVPIITRVSSECSSERSSNSKCVLLCSVMNVTQVTLSWYKGNSLLSSISVSDLNTLSLPLEVEYQDNNTYSCVVNNPISKQTKHLYITDHCQLCSESRTSLYLLVLIPVILVLALIGGICAYWKYGNERQAGCCCNRSHSVLKCCNVNWGPNSPLVYSTK